MVARSPSSALLPFFGEGSHTKIDYRKKGTLLLTSLLEDLGGLFQGKPPGKATILAGPIPKNGPTGATAFVSRTGLRQLLND